MKIHLFLQIIVAFILILLPITSNHEKSFEIQPFDIYSLIIIFIFTAVIYFLYKKICTAADDNAKEKTNDNKKYLYTILLSAALFANAFFWSFIAEKAGNSSVIVNGLNKINFFTYFNLFFGIILFASYEEFLYRFYAPKLCELVVLSVKNKIGNRLSNIILQICELVIICLFALGHLYGGIFSVLNAFCAGIMLRLFAKKISAPIYVISAHSLFNLIQYLFLINTLA